MRRLVATVVVSTIALLTLAACPSDNCTQVGSKKYYSTGQIDECQQRSYESRPHWHQIQPPR